MKLKEHEAREFFEEFGLAVPKGFVTSDTTGIDLGGMGDVMVKAQVTVGGRGKAGGVLPANQDTVDEVASKIIGMDLKGLIVKEVLIEEKLAIDKELYISMIINRSDRNITFIFSEEGGVDIESLSTNQPEKMFKFGFTEFNAEVLETNLSKFTSYAQDLVPIAQTLHKIMMERDCELVEINPLVIVDGKLIASDAKIIIDDNALFRHKEFVADKKEQLTPIEQKALEYDLNYVELEGDIAIIGNGAGLVMATLDIVNHFGGSCADFLDVGGGASVEKMEHSMDIVLMKKPKGLFINIFGGITHCDFIAQGIVNYLEKNKLDIPMVVRMIGTNEKEAKEILRAANIPSLDSLEQCAQKIVEMSQ